MFIYNVDQWINLAVRGIKLESISEFIDIFEFKRDNPKGSKLFVKPWS